MPVFGVTKLFLKRLIIVASICTNVYHIYMRQFFTYFPIQAWLDIHHCSFLLAYSAAHRGPTSFSLWLLHNHECTDCVPVGNVAVLTVDTGNTILGKELLVICIGCCVPLDAGCCIVATWFSLFISNCHPGTFLAVMCLLACFVKWSDLMKRLPQRGQAKRFSPVWVRLCLASSSDLANRLSQFSHVQGKGFSPEIVQNKPRLNINFHLKPKIPKIGVHHCKNVSNVKSRILKFNTKPSNKEPLTRLRN